MKQEDMVKALAELDEKLYVIHKPIHDPFGYYREYAHGYTTLQDAWRVSFDVGSKYTAGRKTDYDRVVLEPAPEKKYLESYDAILGLVQKQSPLMITQFVDFLCDKILDDHYDGSDYISQCDIGCLFRATPAQLCEALLKATGKWQE